MQWKKFWVGVAAAVLLVVGVVAVRWLAGSGQSGIVVEGIVVNTKPMHLVTTRSIDGKEEGYVVHGFAQGKARIFGAGKSMEDITLGQKVRVTCTGENSLGPSSLTGISTIELMEQAEEKSWEAVRTFYAEFQSELSIKLPAGQTFPPKG